MPSADHSASAYRFPGAYRNVWALTPPPKSLVHVGITIGSLLRKLNPSVTVVLALLADTVVAVIAALFYGLIPLVLLGLTAGLAQALAKLSLDSTIQRDIPSRIQASAFARSDTTLQLAWVIGGFVGIAMPLMPQLGLGIAAVVLGVWATFVLVSRPRRATAAPPARA